MTHARTQIVVAVSALLSGLATTQSRVNRTRVYSRDESELPSVSIFFDGEDSQPVTLRGGERLMRRLAKLQIVGHAMTLDGIETQLDTIAAEIETAMAQPIMVGSVEVAGSLISTTIDTTSTEQQIGEIALTYQVTYSTLENSPSVLL